MKDKELKKKILYTLFVLAVSCLLTQIPVIGINSVVVEQFFLKVSVFEFVNSLSGGAASQLTMAGFGVTSYITASIVLQLLSMAFPSMEKMWSNGAVGQDKLKKVTFILAMFITFFSGLSLAIVYGEQGLFENNNSLYKLLAVISWMIGSFIIIILAQSIDRYGIGNGISMILGINIISRIPMDLKNFYNDFVSSKDIKFQILSIICLCAAFFVVYLLTIYLQCGFFNVEIKHMRKERSAMNRNGWMPITANIVSVLPVIYASTLMAIPAIITAIAGINKNGNLSVLLEMFDSSHWYTPENAYHIVGLIIYIALIFLLGSYASKIVFNPSEIAYRMRENGDIIPNVQPGAETIYYLEYRKKIMTNINILFLLVIAIVPDFICARLGISNFHFLGTSLVIVVSVLFDTALRVRAAAIHNNKKYQLFPK